VFGVISAFTECFAMIQFASDFDTFSENYSI